MPAPLFEDTEDLPAFHLHFLGADGKFTVATIYESGYSEGLPEGTLLVNKLTGNQAMRRALRVAEAESVYE